MGEGGKMRKRKMAFNEESGKVDGFQHVSGCFKYFFIFIVKFLSWIGLIPLKMGGSTKMYEFKLFSASTIFSFFRLLIFTFPILILPPIFLFGGPAKEEYEEATGEPFVMETPYPAIKELMEVEFYMNFLIYVLPFAFAYVSVEHFNKSFHVQVGFQNKFIKEDKPNFVNLKQVLFPVVGFLLFLLGKVLHLSVIFTKMDSIHFSLYINLYSNICYFVLVHIPLHFLLAMHENFLYQSFNMFKVMCSWTLNAKDQSTLLEGAKMLPVLMEAIQGGFGFFILVDITLMLIYWLLHLYNAYFTFQVRKRRHAKFKYAISGRSFSSFSIRLDHTC